MAQNQPEGQFGQRSVTGYASFSRSLQQILNTISAAQNTAAAATSLIGSVRSDVDNILNIIRQTGLLVKQFAGVARQYQIFQHNLPQMLKVLFLISYLRLIRIV